MGKLASAGFRAKDTVPVWHTIQKNNSIPEAYRSPLNTSGRGQVGLGYLKAVTELLTLSVTVGREKTYDAFSVTYASGGNEKTARSEQNPNGRQWIGSMGVTFGPRLLLLEALLRDEHPDVKDAFFVLFTKLRDLIGRPWPFAHADLTQHASDCDGEMMLLCDTMYFAVLQLKSTDEVEHVEGNLSPLTTLDLHDILEPPAEPVAPQVAGSLPGRLKRLVQRGGATMLLSGPSASFKSTFVRQAAADAGAALFIVQGTRSIEPIDLLGSVQVIGGDTKWVDGPVASAMRNAQCSKTLLLIDEAYRMEPHNLNAIIPMLDRITAEILPSMGLAPLTDGPHFVLNLPEERIPAPVENLSVALTTNIGSGFIQPADTLDGALETRLRFKFHLERPGREVTEPIYRAVLDDDLVLNALYALEQFTAENLIRDGGLFSDSLSVTTNLAFLEEVKPETEGGIAVNEAFCDTAAFTLAPAVCPRDDYGRYEDAAYRTFMDKVRRVSP